MEGHLRQITGLLLLILRRLGVGVSLKLALQGCALVQETFLEVLELCGGECHR